MSKQPKRKKLPLDVVRTSGFMEWHSRQLRSKSAVTQKSRCPQCGKQYRARACGPTHALILAERKRK